MSGVTGMMYELDYGARLHNPRLKERSRNGKYEGRVVKKGSLRFPFLIPRATLFLHKSGRDAQKKLLALVGL